MSKNDVSNKKPGLLARIVGHTDHHKQLRERKVEDLLPREDEWLGKAYDSRLFRRLMAFTLPYKGLLVLSLLLMMVTSLLSAAGPFLIGQAIDKGIRNSDLNALRLWALLFIGASSVEWLANRTRIVVMAWVGTRVVADLRSHLYRHLHALSLHFYSNYSIGRLMSRLIGDVGSIQDFMTWSITGFVRALFLLIGIVVFMVAMNLPLALLTFTVLPVMFILTAKWRAGARAAYRATRQRLALINGYLNESVSGVRVTQSFVREPVNAKHFDDLNSSFLDANVGASRLSALFFPSVDFIGALATAMVIGVGGWLALHGNVTAGTLVAFLLYVERFFEPIRDLAQRYNTFQSTMASSERLFHLLDTQPDLQDAPNARTLPPIEGVVEFEHVGFWYKDGEPVLRDINLLVKPGERVALVGETGAGKSTFIRLLSRFYDVKAGAIRIDGHDLRDVTQESLRKQMGVVLQETFLFSGSIADNLRYGKLDATDEEIRAAAKAVGAHAFISRLPDGYETQVGENGVNLSAGQRQLLSFARTLLADPRILILDEATSSVDTATEQLIQQALDVLMRGRTSFVIAHRLNTIVNSDTILVLDHGKIVEMGDHQTLLARRGRYYHLYTMQWAQEESLRN